MPNASSRSDPSPIVRSTILPSRTRCCSLSENLMSRRISPTGGGLSSAWTDEPTSRQAQRLTTAPMSLVRASNHVLSFFLSASPCRTTDPMPALATVPGRIVLRNGYFEHLALVQAIRQREAIRHRHFLLLPRRMSAGGQVSNRVAPAGLSHPNHCLLPLGPLVS